MSEQNIIPSCKLPEDFRLKKICDCQKELENEISHYKHTCKKYKRAKSIVNAFATSTGILAVVLSSSGLAASLNGIGAVVGAPLAGIAGLMVSAAEGSVKKSQNMRKPFLSLNPSIFPSAD